ncbi:hypothetical protein B0H10DRAFT_1359576 [Mycena sp. CBHHK59/15]|nr:hypothetical protein B0H10DRAFT_1359576 [Mycena sp. CBHHK59/15]
MVGDDDSLKDPVFRAMIRAGELDGEVYLATEIGSMKVVGVAVWFPPGKSLFATEEQRALGFDEFFEKLSPEIKKFLERYGIVLLHIVLRYPTLGQVRSCGGNSSRKRLAQQHATPFFIMEYTLIKTSGRLITGI